MSPRPLCIVALVVGLAAPAHAHDFWIEPSSFSPRVGQAVGLTLREGEAFVGVSQPFVRFAFEDFSVSGPGGRHPVEGSTGDDPAGAVRLDRPGIHVVGYHSTRSFVQSGPARFAEFLRAEGLEHVLALREARGASGLDATELFSRCAKALVRVGPADGEGFDRRLGYPLELVPRRDPTALAPGQALPLELLLHDAPIAGVLVVAFPQDEPGARVSARTDDRGRVSLPLDRPARWLVKAVHLFELSPKHPRARWESLWASLTFELRGGVGPAPSAAP